MTPNQIPIGIIGAGRIGKVHAENLAFRVPEARALAITDLNRDAAQRVASRCGIPTVAASVDQILADPGIQAVLICSSTDTHADLIVRAAQAGKHIFCEKPIAHSLAKIDSALAAVQQAGVKLQIGFNRRFDPNFARVRAAVTGGEIGTPRLLHIISRDPAPPPVSYVKVSGGIFLDMTIHDFDMARFLIGDEVEEMSTAWMAGSARIWSVEPAMLGMPQREATRSAASRFRSVMARVRASGTRKARFSAWTVPMRPAPMMPTFSR